LDVNGEGIYGTRAMAPYAEGRIRMTRGKDGSAFFFYLAEEKETALPAEIRVKSHRPAEGGVVTLLGSRVPLEWKPEARVRRLRARGSARRPAVGGRVDDQSVAPRHYVPLN